MSTLGVIVLSLPGMKRLNESLESVRWADAVVVLHAGEEAPEITAALPSRSVVRRVDFAQAPKLPVEEIRTDWVVRLWGEERIEPELQEELRALCRLDLATAKPSYRVHLRTRLLNHWVEGSLWEPSPAPRVTRAADGIASGWWSERGRQDDQGLGRLRGRIGDYCALELRDGVERINRVSSLWAEDMQRRSSWPGAASIVLFSLRVFLKLLFRNRLFARGLPGLTLSTLAAYATLLSGAKVWEARNAARRKASG